MHLHIFTPAGEIYSGKVSVVEVPTLSGVIGILPHHRPLTTLVSTGMVKFVPKEKEERILDSTSFLFENDRTLLAVDEGIVYIEQDTVRLFVRYGNDNLSAESFINEITKAHLKIKNLQK
ncbi:F0F1 ATP synthase subunit epsilon [bacterium]|nr:F0F1 ATP synthase subunit epsilon [bacterium]